MDCEVIIADDMSARGRKMLEAMAAAAPSSGVKAVVTTSYRGYSHNVMTYGLGHVGRRPALEGHRAKGGRLIGWDMGYWNRDEPARFNMRLTIDADHPHNLIRHESPQRFDAIGIKLREDADHNGPIILVGLGRKQRKLRGEIGQEWERRKLVDLRRRFPGRRIVYRPKRLETFSGLPVIANIPIAQVLKGASLVVCHHSNVAVDACIAGVPVECEDGAALALYRENPSPSHDRRLAFLRSLAHWQYNPKEAVTAWNYIERRLSD